MKKKLKTNVVSLAYLFNKLITFDENYVNEQKWLLCVTNSKP